MPDRLRGFRPAPRSQSEKQGEELARRDDDYGLEPDSQAHRRAGQVIALGIYQRPHAHRQRELADVNPRLELEIDERCGRLWSEPKEEQREYTRLSEAHETRLKRAEQVYERLRTLLPPEHWADFDASWEAWHEKFRLMSQAPTVNVRP